MYKMSEFCSMVGMPKSKIIFYEKKGLFNTPRQSNGYRVFTPNDAFRVNAFLNLLQYGFTVEKAIELLDSKQSNESFIQSLDSQIVNIEQQIELLKYRKEKVERTRHFMNYFEKDTYEIQEFEDYIYCQASYRLDFSLAVTHASTLAKFYENLSVASCSRIIELSDVIDKSKEICPSYISAIPEKSAYLLGDYEHSHVKIMKLGKSIVHARTKTRTESIERESFDGLLNYIKVNNLTAKGYIFLMPTFLNLDGNGSDIELLIVPIS